MIEYVAGDRIKDMGGAEWIITHTWEYKEWLCLGLLKADQPDVFGGTRIAMGAPDGGLVVTRR